MGHSDLDPAIHDRRPWNVGKNVGAKRPLKPRDIWMIRFYLDEHKRLRDRVLFDIAIDSKLRGCDLVKLRIGDLDECWFVSRSRDRHSAKDRSSDAIRNHVRGTQEPDSLD